MNDWPARGRWCLYLIECRNGSWYAGISNHLEARYAAHASGRGARYTRANPPVRLLGWRDYPDRASASRAEWQIKRLPKQRKLAFLQADQVDRDARSADQYPITSPSLRISVAPQ